MLTRRVPLPPEPLVRAEPVDPELEWRRVICLRLEMCTIVYGHLAWIATQINYDRPEYRSRLCWCQGA